MTKNCVQCLFQGKVTETYPIPQYFLFLKCFSTYAINFISQKRMCVAYKHFPLFKHFSVFKHLTIYG